MSKTRALATSPEKADVEPELNARTKAEINRRARYYARKLKAEEQELSGNALDFILTSFAPVNFYSSRWRIDRDRTPSFYRENERIKAYAAIAMEKAVAQSKK